MYQELAVRSDAGGLLSYGPSWKERYRLLGHYARKILRPPDLPVMLPGSRVGNSRWLRQVRVWQGSWWWNSVKTILNCLL